MRISSNHTIGISAISVYEPGYHLSNAWFEGLSRKFVHHTGIEARPLSSEDEVGMAVRAVQKLRSETGCQLSDCAAVVFVSPSFVPMLVAQQNLSPRAARRESLSRAGKRLMRRIGLAGRPVFALNWFCSGYAKAMEVVRRRVLRSIELTQHQFVLVVTSGRISRITDYGCHQTAPLFGDLATATLLAAGDHPRFPAHFTLRSAFAQKQPATGVFFDFHLGRDVPLPTLDGGRQVAAERLVYTLDGMGIADAAPRAMSAAVAQALTAAQCPPEMIRFVVPHQAGTGIVRLTSMKLESLGIRGEIINGLTRGIGNVSSSSIPYALKQSWDRLEGMIACPTAAVGTPGKAEVSQGCVLLESTPHHRHLGIRAA